MYVFPAVMQQISIYHELEFVNTLRLYKFVMKLFQVNLDWYHALCGPIKD